MAWTNLGQHAGLHTFFRLYIVLRAPQEHWESFRKRRLQPFAVLQVEVRLVAKLALFGFDVVMLANRCGRSAVFVDLLCIGGDLRGNVSHVSGKNGEAMGS